MDCKYFYGWMKYFLFTLGQQQRGVARLGHSTHRAPGTLRSRNSTLVDTWIPTTLIVCMP